MSPGSRSIKIQEANWFVGVTTSEGFFREIPSRILPPVDAPAINVWKMGKGGMTMDPHIATSIRTEEPLPEALQEHHATIERLLAEILYSTKNFRRNEQLGCWMNVIRDSLPSVDVPVINP